MKGDWQQFVFIICWYSTLVICPWYVMYHEMGCKIHLKFEKFRFTKTEKYIIYTKETIESNHLSIHDVI